MDIKIIMAIMIPVALMGSQPKKHLEVPPVSKLQREDSRQYMQPDEVRPKIVISHGRYRPSSRVVRFNVPQNLDIPPKLRSCSTTCCEREQIEGLPDIPWYLRLFTCCCCRPR
jgi:hypothetical protein